MLAFSLQKMQTINNLPSFDKQSLSTLVVTLLNIDTLHIQTPDIVYVT